ncbi:hypothetical protein SAY87_026234 [Trapa incisa]|uniref:Protein HEADING DATE REPRESSOR 1-like n=1 Tax=Trapa incisa TaxID=236973 RepID=A0AAN7GV27_9MYRT|nr:hypothetical protein SAY87_026234 [Trapa incisa]
MEEGNKDKAEDGGTAALSSFSPPTSTRIFWRSRKRSESGRNLSEAADKEQEDVPADEKMQELTQTPELSECRKGLFQRLDPTETVTGKRQSAESLIPPPDFDTASYPKGWLIGKKRKLVNVDVVESMRRIAVQEMNRKDREIDGLNEQIEEDSRCLEHLHFQILNEKSKRAEVERENTMLRDQISMLMNMLEENEPMDDGQDHNEQ